MHGLSIPKSFKTLAGTYKISSFVAGILFLVLGPWAFAEGTGETYDKMSTRERVGQVFIWTFSGFALSPQTQSWLEKYQPGALIVFKRNIQSLKQIAKLNSDSQSFAQKKLKAPFFLMVDQEGGTVTRLRTEVPLPSALALGRMADPVFIENFAKTKAEVLRGLGFNVNLAPVLDISNPEKDSFIGSRAFGEDPEAVAQMVVAYAKGIHAGGLIPTAKHFPGHGGVAQDSHQTMPKKFATYEELAARDLVPFQQYAQTEFPKALMMAHLALPNIDPSGSPATYSNILIEQDLRVKLKYDGLVITDDLEMNGASIEKDIGERGIRAFLAGNDMLMLAGSPAHQKRAFEALLAAVKSGRIPEARLKGSVQRILDYKQQMKLGTFVYNEEKTKESIASLEGMSREVLKKNFQQAAAGKTAHWPALKPESHVLVLSSDSRFYQSFAENFNGKADFFRLSPQTIDRASKEIGKDGVEIAIYYATGDQTARWLAHLNPELRAKTIVVNANHSGEVEGQSSFLGVLDINSHNPESGGSLAELLTPSGQRTPAGENEDSEPQ